MSVRLPTQLLKHFDRISEAPDAVARLRRFILDLAVRGKLVEQDTNDEPAAELLKRIQVEKALCEKKTKELKSVTKDEAPFDVPAGWKWVRIRQITTDRGQTVPKADFTYIDVTAINKDRGCIGEPTVLSASEAPSRARKVVQKGDVIYSCIRPYLLNIAVINTDIEPLPIASTAFAVMNGFGLTLPQYLWTALRSPFMVESVEACMRGQAYPAINDSDFALLSIPLPPLAEQHRIVAKVDELMTLCDQLEAAKSEREAQRDRLVAASLHRFNHTPRPLAGEEAGERGDSAIPLPEAARFHLDHLTRLTTRPEHIKQLRQTILNLAMLGKLLPQDEAALSKEVELESLVKIVRGSSPRPKGDPQYYGGPIPRLLIADISRDGKHVTPQLDTLTINGAKLSRHMPKGSLVLAISGSYGIPAFLAVDACIHDGFIGFRDVSPLIDPEYLYLVMQFRRPYFDEVVKDSGLKNLTTEHLKRLVVPIYPIEVQNRIVAKVDELSEARFSGRAS